MPGLLNPAGTQAACVDIMLYAVLSYCACMPLLLLALPCHALLCPTPTYPPVLSCMLLCPAPVQLCPPLPCPDALLSSASHHPALALHNMMSLPSHHIITCCPCRSVATIAEDPKFHLAKTLQPGDLEIIHNPTIFHSRGDIFDGDSHAEKRHLLRWWVASDANKRPIAPLFAPRSNVQPTGGFIVPEGSKIRLPLYPYSRHDGQGQAPEE